MSNSRSALNSKMKRPLYQWISFRKNNKASKVSLMQSEMVARVITNFCRKHKLDFLNLERIDIINFANELSSGAIHNPKGVSNSTIVTYLRVLSGALSDINLHSKIYKPVNNVQDALKIWTRTNKPISKVPPSLKQEELDKLYKFNFKDKTKNELRDFFIFLTECPLRKVVGAKLRWSDIQESDGKKYVLIVSKKTQHPTVIKLSKRALEILDRRPRDFGDRIWQYTTRESTDVKELFRIAKIDRPYISFVAKGRGCDTVKQSLADAVTIHTTRHTFAQRMLSKGERIEKVQTMLGHTSIKTTQRYIAKDVETQKALQDL